MGRRRSTGWDSRRTATVRIWAASPARLAPRIRCFCCVAHLARHGPGQRQLSPVPTVAPRPRHPDPSGRRQQRRRLRHAAPQRRCQSGWPACRPPRVRLAGAQRPPRTGRARGPEGPAHATDDHNLGRLSAPRPLEPLGARGGLGPGTAVHGSVHRGRTIRQTAVAGWENPTLTICNAYHFPTWIRYTHKASEHVREPFPDGPPTTSRRPVWLAVGRHNDTTTGGRPRPHRQPTTEGTQREMEGAGGCASSITSATWTRLRCRASQVHRGECRQNSPLRSVHPRRSVVRIYPGCG